LIKSIMLTKIKTNLVCVIKHFKICKNLVTQRVTTSDDCEINLITNTKLSNIKNVRKFKYMSIKHRIFHKLMLVNAWLYTVNEQHLIFTCSNQNQIIKQIYGTGIISFYKLEHWSHRI